MDRGERKDRIAAAMKARFGGGPVKYYRAPGRVDLMGSHTDYNLGWILAATIDRDVLIGARLRKDGQLNFYSLNTEREVRTQVGVKKWQKKHGWANYCLGVIAELAQMGVTLPGLDLVVHGEVPVGGNLSSSAALEAATCEAVLGVTEMNLPPWERVVLTRRAEYVFVGMPCGIMDQFTVIMGSENAAIELDCRSLQFATVPFFAERASLLVIDCGLARSLVKSQYPTRVKECKAAVAVLAGKRPGLRSLRDATAEDVEAMKRKLGDVLYRRARHVVSENDRVLRAGRALKSGKPAELGRIMEEGYRSSRDDYENSSPLLDSLHDIVAAAKGVLGVRVCGAGWGGCLLALAARGREDAIAAEVLPRHREKNGYEGKVWTVKPSAGAGEVE
jgi:galactokinase